MDKKDIYIIPLKDLSVGSHEYEFRLTDDFFERIEAPEVRKGDVHVKVSIKKSMISSEITFKSEGFVYVPCNRCLEDMKQTIDTEDGLVVKFGDAYQEVDDTLVIIPDYPGEIDLSWYMYEFIALNIPIRHVHEEGACSEDMIPQLGQYLTDERNAREDEGQTQSAIDPRWAALQKLLEENKKQGN